MSEPKSLDTLRAAAAAAPQDADAQVELAVALTLAGDMAGAEPAYRAALALRPGDRLCLGNLAGVLVRLGRPGEAEPLFRAVLAADPGNVPALRNLAVLLKDAGRAGEARACAREASRRDDSLEAALQAHLALTPMLPSADDIVAQRAAYAAGLEALAADPRTFAYHGEPANLPWYYLPYHGEADRPLLARTAAVLKAKVAGPADADLSAWRPPEGRRLRVAICSEYLGGHTIGRLFGGLVRRLDRARFEVSLAHGPNGVADAARADLDRAAERAVVLPRDPEGQRAAMAALSPDVLFYPDLGMSAVTWFLAQSRLAPVQATSWGHPVTTGLAAMDYFVSADVIEPPGAEAAYVERLVRLPRLPAWYPTPDAPPAAARGELGLPETGVLYGCPQTLFKLHPDFDAVLAAIAAGDPTGHIVLIGAQNPAWTQVLTERWAARFPDLPGRVTFLRRLNHQGFMAHLAHIDVLLDPWPFGSGNTLYEAASIGTPIVTWPGAFMRSRIVAGAYAQVGMAAPPVATSAQDYVAVALALGREPGRRAALRHELAAKARAGLYEDDAAVRGVEAFLEAAVAAAGRGERLPAGWRPPQGVMGEERG